MDSLFADFQSLSSMTKEKAEKNVQEALNYLRLDFRNLGIVISQYHPLEVLKMAAWEERRIVRTKSREPFSAVSGRLLPVLLQSIIQSTFFDVSHGISTNRNIKEKDWQRIRSLVDDAAKRLLRCIECYTVLMIRTGMIKEENAPLYREALFEEAFPPAEDKERIERTSYMTYGSMQSAKDVIIEQYGAEPEFLVSEMYKIVIRGLEGIDRLSEEASIYKAEVETMMAQKRAADPERIITDEDLIHEIIKENGWETRVARLAGERDDFDLFRPDFVSNLPRKTYETLSVYPGTVDLDAMMMKGIWPATIYPFIHFGDMFFSFVSQHIQSYGIRILQETAGLPLRYTDAAFEALKLLFNETDELDVYSFDGNKIDVSILSSLVEVNAFTSPELFQARIERRAEEKKHKPAPGHKGLIVEPDDFESLAHLSDNIFTTSVYCLMKSSTNPQLRKNVYKTIFGQLEMPEADEYDAIIDPEEIENEEKIIDDDVLSDDITDEYEYEAEDEDEKEKRLEEKEKELEKSIPEDFSDYERSAEIEKLVDKYALTNDIIKREEEMEAESDEYEKELDSDDFSSDDSVDDDVVDDDVDPVAEKLYDEAEKDDIYADENYTDPDQLTFFDELFSDEEEKDFDKSAEEELEEEDEEEYEKAEEEAEAFSASGNESILDSSIKEATDEAESDESSETVSTEELKETSISDEEAYDISASNDNASTSTAEENDTMPGEESESSEEGEASATEPEIAETTEDKGPETVSAEELKETSISDEEAADISASNDNASTSTAEENDTMTGEESENSEEGEESATEPEIAETTEDKGSDTTASDEEHEDAGSAVVEAVKLESESAAMPLYEEDHSEEAITPSEENETTESLIDKGLVKPVELAGGGRVFVMTEAESERVVEEEEEQDDKLSDLHGILHDIAEKLDSSSAFLSFLANSDYEMRDYLERVIKSSWERQRADGKDKMFSIYDYSISVVIASGGVNDELRKEGLLNNAGAVMYSKHKDEWNALILSLDDDFALVDAFERKITPQSFSPSNWKICRVIGQQLIDRSK
ncbi:MAG: hypothetical protein IAA97_01270 [Spirochaetes bacterium]|uniref:Uncharacterized protein n=1 Tax=Candidatus Ornithospirochaeta stercoripullorum TaxID=2840899 RepID=A0A9D9DYX4_9SPIO|nr:hypothetical protein [Candidatus Ornithospirochaeta stercoripullorum]